MSLRRLPFLFALFALPFWASRPAPASPGYLVVANQVDHTVLVIDLAKRQQRASVTVGINGHEVAVSPDLRFAYVPIYGNSGVGKPGTDGGTMDVVDLHRGALAGTVDLGKSVRPHCARFGPGGLLYVTAELDSSIYLVDTHARKVIAKIPTGAIESHMLVISPHGRRAYTSNVHAGSVSVLDLEKRALLAVIPVAQQTQRIAISPDGRRAFTHDQDQPRIAVIDTARNEVSNWISLPAPVFSSAVNPAGDLLIANSTAGKVFFVDLRQMKVTRSVDVPMAMGEIAITPDGSVAYVTCPQSGTIEILNLKTGEKTGSITLTKGVDGVEWVPEIR